ncbi:hypothetical protein ASPWEDRAFT_507237 [Aspergillus wentii DTO 134E9]|uniref:NmrA-like domain-containing protein n=1 Tax=Aspergillus wentii DTO 134E9 TaxID=1073089 RepID=A0A1L9RKG9_ASPWE|nr:uncharacterized protein ASPWEDRAFT_507237 [Aspergillus wentii DTO 134E9]OJJ35404.1 hypothetical protein ASPWEDRAFT_507237 [Aspergillus wentii DTO 134E9]
MSLTNIAIIGATGNIGKIILNALITSNLPLTITLLTRHEPPPTPTLPPNITLTIQQTDFSSSLIAAFTGKDTIISAVGATAFTEQQKYIDAAVHAGVKRFIPSEFSVSSQNEAVLGLLPLFGQKREVVEYLRLKEGEGLSWTGIACSGLFDWVWSGKWIPRLRYPQSHSCHLGWRREELYSHQ